MADGERNRPPWGSLVQGGRLGPKMGSWDLSPFSLTIQKVEIMRKQFRILFVAVSMVISISALPSFARDRAQDQNKMEGKNKMKDKDSSADEKMTGDKTPGDQDKMKDKVTTKTDDGKMAKSGRKRKKDDKMKGEKMKDGKMKEDTMKERQP
jgi:hypothetical protein